jgi:hypothetical protein
MPWRLVKHWDSFTFTCQLHWLYGVQREISWRLWIMSRIGCETTRMWLILKYQLLWGTAKSHQKQNRFSGRYSNPRPTEYGAGMSTIIQRHSVRRNWQMALRIPSYLPLKKLNSWHHRVITHLLVNRLQREQTYMGHDSKFYELCQPPNV